MKRNQINFLFSLLLLFVPSLMAGTARFNCGGPAMQVGNLLYQADEVYTAANGAGAIGGTTHVISLPKEGVVVEGTLAQDLFASVRYGMREYRFDVPNGIYMLTLQMTELVENGPGLRQFSVVAEGKTLLDHFDIYAYIEKNYALTFRFAVSVTDGQLNVTFPAIVGQPILSAISVDTATRDTVPPTAPSPVTGLGGYYRNIITWPDVPDTDLAGYLVYGSDSAAGTFTLLNQMPTPVSRYFDDAVTPGQPRWYRVSAVDIFGNRSIASQPVGAIALDKSQSPLPFYELTISPENLRILESDPTTDDYVDADFTYNGTVYPDIGARFRGNSSRTYEKKSWKLNFKKEQPFGNNDKLDVKAGGMDASLIRECLATAMYELTPTLIGTCNFTNLSVNGEYRGVFKQVEDLNSDYLKAHGLNNDGKLFEGEFDEYSNFQILDDYSIGWDDDSKTEDGYGTLAQLIETINNTPDATFDSTIASILNIDTYLNFYATTILQGDIDHTGHNYDMYQNPDSLIWEIVARDFDASFKDAEMPINYGTKAQPDQSFGVYNVLTERLLQVPRFRQWYVNKLTELLQSDFTWNVVGAQINSMLTQVKHDGTRDVFKRYREVNTYFQSSGDNLKAFMQQRRTSVMAQIPGYSPGIAQAMMLNEIMADNANGPTDEQGEHEDWVELYNRGASPFDLSGYYLTDDPTNRTKWRFPDGTTVPAGGHLLVWCDNEPGDGPLHATFNISKKGQSVALYGPDASGNPLLDVIAFGPQATDVTYGRRLDGSAMWGVQTSASPNGPNAGARMAIR